jgi:hypothetical protein
MTMIDTDTRRDVAVAKRRVAVVTVAIVAVELWAANAVLSVRPPADAPESVDAMMRTPFTDLVGYALYVMGAVTALVGLRFIMKLRRGSSGV